MSGAVLAGNGMAKAGAMALPPAAPMLPRCEMPGQGRWGPKSRPSQGACQGHPPPAWVPVILTLTPSGAPKALVTWALRAPESPGGHVTGGGGQDRGSLCQAEAHMRSVSAQRSTNAGDGVLAPSVCSWEHVFRVGERGVSREAHVLTQPWCWPPQGPPDRPCTPPTPICSGGWEQATEITQHPHAEAPTAGSTGWVRPHL